jgi:hypothetical protein
MRGSGWPFVPVNFGFSWQEECTSVHTVRQWHAIVQGKGFLGQPGSGVAGSRPRYGGAKIFAGFGWCLLTKGLWRDFSDERAC